MLHFRNLQWFSEKCRQTHNSGILRSLLAHRLVPMLSPQTPKAPHNPATAQCPSRPTPCSVLLSAQQCSLLSARFSPLRFSSHFHFLGALSHFLHLQSGPLSSELLWCVSTTLIPLTTFRFTMACVSYQIAASIEAEESELKCMMKND